MRMEPGFARRCAASLLLARSMWLRMPPWLLAYHTLAKLWRGAWRRPQETESG